MKHVESVILWYYTFYKGRVLFAAFVQLACLALLAMADFDGFFVNFIGMVLITFFVPWVFFRIAQK